MILESGNENNIKIKEGVYAWFSGPSFETPAEIKAIQYLGADVVGMSTVPEVILARYFKIKVAGISVITNMAAGLSNENISHEQTKEIAKLSEKKLSNIIISLLRKI
jgi:purine-nucleoside phosphorylase